MTPRSVISIVTINDDSIFNGYVGYREDYGDDITIPIIKFKGSQAHTTGAIVLYNKYVGNEKSYVMNVSDAIYNIIDIGVHTGYLCLSHDSDTSPNIF